MSPEASRNAGLMLSVLGMTCPTCEGSLERALGQLPGVRSARADHHSCLVEVEFDVPPSEAALRRAVEDAGHDLEDLGAG